MTFYYHHVFNGLTCPEYFIKEKAKNSTKTVHEAEYCYCYHVLRLKLQIFFKNIRGKHSQCVIKLFKNVFLSVESRICQVMIQKVCAVQVQQAVLTIQKTTLQIVSVCQQQNQYCLILDNSITPSMKVFTNSCTSAILKNGFICKICTVFCGDSLFPGHTSRGAWSQKGVMSKENPGEKLR